MQLIRQPNFKPAKAIGPEEQEDLKEKSVLIDALLQNRISVEGLRALREKVTPEDLSNIIQRIYDLNEKYIFNLSAVEGMLRRLNDIKNEKRNARFMKKIQAGFRDQKNGDKKIILAEGDSWFNYPLILTDIIDRISMDEDFALYSLASGGDWFLNMLTGREYVEELSLLHPHVFLISGGGNDLVGSRRLAAIVEPACCKEFEESKWASLLVNNANREHVSFRENDFNEGVQYLSKDFFALLMFFHLQYYFLIKGIAKGGNGKPPKFIGMRIITQGYDYAIPSYAKGVGLNPLNWYIPVIRQFLGHGSWLKTPLQMRGIRDVAIQKKIIYAMIYLFNEMMIEIGIIFKDAEGRSPVFHIDSRESVGDNGWVDELHAKPRHIIKTGEVFVRCIKDASGKSATYGNVYVVKKF